MNTDIKTSNKRHLIIFVFMILIFGALLLIWPPTPVLSADECLPAASCQPPTGKPKGVCPTNPSMVLCGPGFGAIGGDCVDDGDCPGTAKCINSICSAGTANDTSGTNGGAIEALPNPLGTTDISTLIGNVIKALLGVTGSIALLMFIYGGILWLTSGGNEKRVEQGKSVLTWATIGLGIIFTSYILVNFVINSLTSG